MSTSLGSIMGSVVQVALQPPSDPELPSSSIAMSFGHPQTEYSDNAQNHASGVHTMPAGNDALSKFVPEGGLHPVVTEPTTQAKTQAKSTHAKPAGISDFGLLIAAIAVSLDHAVNGLGRPRG